MSPIRYFSTQFPWRVRRFARRMRSINYKHANFCDSHLMTSRLTSSSRVKRCRDKCSFTVQYMKTGGCKMRTEWVFFSISPTEWLHQVPNPLCCVQSDISWRRIAPPQRPTHFILPAEGLKLCRPPGETNFRSGSAGCTASAVLIVRMYLDSHDREH